MGNLLGHLTTISVLVFVLLSMFSTGTSIKLNEILKHMHNVRLIILSIAVSFILVPLTAGIISWLLFLDKPFKIGLILFSMSAGNEALPNLSHRVKANKAFAVALMALQIAITMIYIPLIITFLLPETNMALGTLFIKLAFIVFLPLGTGLYIKRRWEAAAAKLYKVTHLIAEIVIVFIFIFVLIHAFDKVVSVFGSRAILAGFILLSISAAAGYFVGGPSMEIKKVLCFGSCGRNAGIALLVASQAFNDHRIAVMVVVMTVVMIVTFLPILLILRRL